jgi:hypothetical protein
MVMTTRNRRIVLSVVAAAAVACSYSHDVVGRLAAEDGTVGVACVVTVGEREWRQPDECGSRDADGLFHAGPIPLGGTLLCRVSGNVERIYELTAACPGYARLVVPFEVASCAGSWFGGCDEIDLGTVTVRK